jgi:hypothetical protein
MILVAIMRSTDSWHSPQDLVGPFPDEDTARSWAETNLPRTVWAIVEPVPPTN